MVEVTAVAVVQADRQEGEDNLIKNTNEEIYTNANGSYSSYH